MDHFAQSIAALQAKLHQQEEKATETKKAINALCAACNRDSLYPDAEQSDAALKTLHADTFYGHPLNGSAKRVLEMRKAVGLGATSVRDIYDVLVQGGFDFKAKNDKNAMDGLRISLGKASHTFHKLPNGMYGLSEWYPSAKTKKIRRSGVNGEPESDGASEQNSSEGAQEIPAESARDS